VTVQSIKGFLLSRQWRDFADGIEISFWASTSRGPLRIKVPAQQAVCFIDRDQPFDLNAAVQRKEVELKSTAGEPVDALYFKAQRNLKDAASHSENLLHESDIKPADRYLMERFVSAGFEATGTIVEQALFNCAPLWRAPYCSDGR